MKLRPKALLVSLITSIIAIGVALFAVGFIVIHYANLMQEHETQRDLERIVQTVEREKEMLTAYTMDYAYWDDTYQFAVDRDPKYITVNFIPDTYKSLSNDFAIITNTNKEVIFAGQLSADKKKIEDISSSLRIFLISEPVLFQSMEKRKPVSGIVRESGKWCLVSSAPILASDRSGEPHGILIFGRFIEDSYLKKISQTTQQNFDIQEFDGLKLPEEFKGAKAHLSRNNPFYFINKNSRLVSGFTLIDDISGKPALIVKMKPSESIYALSRAYMKTLLIAVVLISLGFSLVLIIMQDRLTISRILRLSRDVRKISRGEVEVRRVSVKGRDEIGQLSMTINDMITSLEQAVDHAREILETTTETREDNARSLARLSDELHTPVAGIVASAKMLLESNLDHHQREDIALIQKSGESILDMINEMLDLSKMKSGILTLENIPFDMNKIISEVTVPLGNLAKEKGLNFRYFVDDNVPQKLIGDPTRFKQIINNLVSNAVKFTDKGFVHVSVEAAGRADKNVGLILSVKDTGIGMSKEKQDAIFKSHERSDVSAARTYGGTGLGLSITQEMVKLMGGTLKVNSKIGSGSEFVVEIKLGVANM